MSLNAILEAIRASGQTEVARIEAQAQAQAKAILAQAQAEAERLQQGAKATGMFRAKQEDDRILQEARSQVLKIVGKAQQALVEQCLARTRQQLAGLRGTSTYPAVLRHLTVEALEELSACLEGGEGICLRADQRDQELIESFLAEHYPDMLVDYDLDCWGGIVAQSEDGRIVAINTLQARFERGKPHLERYVANLFESKKNMH